MKELRKRQIRRRPDVVPDSSSPKHGVTALFPLSKFPKATADLKSEIQPEEKAIGARRSPPTFRQEYL